MPFVPPARHLLRAKDLADARYFEPLGVDDLARAAGLSRAHFSREFRRAFGESPHAYLLTRRLERAAALLRDDRPLGRRHLLLGRAAERRLVHDAASRARTVSRRPRTARGSRPPRPTRSSRRAWCAPTAARNVSTFREDSARPAASVLGSIQSTTGGNDVKLASAQLWVHDQDEALAFYTEKLGMEVRSDVTLPEMGNFRWLTVGPPDQADVADRADGDPRAAGDGRRDRRAGAGADGARASPARCSSRPTTCQASYEELTARGVEFTEAPEERPYGIDAGFRDPSGNNFRLTQVTLAGV